MTRIVWDKEDEKTYENGVSHGVLYPETTPGVVWNGLKTVAESYDGGEIESLYFESSKYLDVILSRIFKADVTAFSAPKEFNPCIGNRPLIPGVYLTGQPRDRFGFSYQTGVNEDDYKIHIVYNCTATPTSLGYATNAETPAPSDLSWKFDAVPIRAINHKPTAHYILDARKIDPEDLAIIEDLLYGTDSSEPQLPDPTLLGSLFPVTEEFLIDLDTGTGYGSLTSDPDGDISETYVEGVYQIVPTGHLVETVDPGFYTLEV